MTEGHQVPIQESTDGWIHLAAKLFPVPLHRPFSQRHTKKVHNSIISMNEKWPYNTWRKQ